MNQNLSDGTNVKVFDSYARYRSRWIPAFAGMTVLFFRTWNLQLLSALPVFLFLAACAVGPDYERPSTDTPPAYKEAGDWKPAAPQDAENRGPWWKVYNDPVLNGLEEQIDISNQNLKAAEAAYRAARAVVAESQAALFPTLSLNGSAIRSGAGQSSLAISGQPGGATAQTLYSASTNASWEPDIWGRIRRTVEGDVATAEASAADLASARLSAQAALAIDYFNLRAQDELKALLEATAKAQTGSLKIAQNQYKVGVAAKADVVAAQTQLESTQAQAINAGLLRAQLEHAIAVLIGKTPSVFALAPAPFAKEVPSIPAEVPSMLLERRPDIAAAERLMAAANTQIGVQTAAYFPNLTLSASYGFAASALSKLFQASNSLWSFGPALAETVFDAGLREAQVEQAKAGYDQSVATYRQTVLTAFQQVEDQLAALRILTQQAESETAVVKSAHEAERLVLNQYKAGIVPFSSVIAAQTATFSNEQTALAVHQNRFVASVTLIEALGGSWDRSQLPTVE
jgi:NodT family efflux transporter outer membrane factor (OMF) lipoprotein